MKFYKGSVNSTPFTLIRDSGSTCVGIKRCLLRKQDFTGEKEKCTMFDGSETMLDVAFAHIETPFYTGIVKALALNNPVADIILGNIADIDDTIHFKSSQDSDPDTDEDNKHQAYVLTRAAAKSEHGDRPPNIGTNSAEMVNESKNEPKDFQDLKNSGIDFLNEQNNDTSLDSIREKAAKGDGYIVKDGLLFRMSKKPENNDQVVVPNKLRQMVLHCCHDSPVAGHMGISATKKRICSQFTWPGIMADIANYVKSCDICQRICNKLPRLPIEQADMITTPFDKIAIDIVGPMPITDNKYRYILTVIDLATRWPESIPLKDIRTTDVANALFTIFTRLGVPREIQTDNGQQLVSNAMKEVLAMMGIEHRQNTPYHSQSMGIIERQNGTLKSMLYKLTNDKPNTWDKLLPAVLFAYREVPNASTGYPPFTLMYGREVRGPAKVLADIFTNKKDVSEEYMFVNDYVRKLHSDIKTSCEIAAKNAEEQLARHRENKNKHTRYRQFTKGDKVLILLPKDGNNLFMKYQGPYLIEAVSNNNNYICRVGNQVKRYHANILKKYFERTLTPPFDHVNTIACVAYVEEDFSPDSE